MSKNIIWIDENIYNLENRATLVILKYKLKNYNFYTYTSVSSAISEIKSNEKFHFNLFYVIVSGKLADSFFNEYVLVTIDYPVLAATIIYCYNQNFYEKKPYYLDSFLNPGKIVKTYDKIIEYIKKDECHWKDNMNITNEKYHHNEKKFGFSFNYTQSLSEIVYPIYLQNIIDSTLISSSDIKELQDFLLKYFSQYKELIKPSQEKNIFIPYHLLAKFLLRLYTVEFTDRDSSFYK
eukprot:jgi/Orpsp1_1/1183749/evm.model.c7180000086573.1